MISYLYSSTPLSLSSHPVVLWDIDSSYLNGTFPLVRGLGSQPSWPSSHSIRGASKHCQSACAAPSPPFSSLLVYLGSREWWWAPSGKIVEGIVDGKDVMLCYVVMLIEDACVPLCGELNFSQGKSIGHTCHFLAAPGRRVIHIYFYCTCFPVKIRPSLQGAQWPLKPICHSGQTV